MFYTGIGSRKTPEHVLNKMINIGMKAVNLGFILRSGGAKGADSAFELGCDKNGGKKEIYIPWKGFNGKYEIVGTNPKAGTIAKKFHPAWNRCSPAVRKLHTRNVYQLLGLDLTKPSSILICWTPDGKICGGTGMAIRIAMSVGIKIINLYDGQ